MPNQLPLQHRVQRGLMAAVFALFAAFWVITFALSEPPEFRQMYFVTAALVGVVAALWATALRMLQRAWWARTLADQAIHDGPALLAALSAAALADERREWAAAMTAELAHIDDRAARWRFARGCARTALFPHRDVAPVILVAAIAAVASAAVGLAVDAALPALRIFAIVFTALVGAIVTLVVAQSRPQFDLRPRIVTAALALAAVVACIAATAYFLVKNPSGSEHLSTTAAVSLAAMLSAALGLALFPPRDLAASCLARSFGVTAAALLGVGLVWTARLSAHTLGGPIGWILFAPIVLFFAAALAVAAIRGSFRAGVEAAVWAALLGSLAVFALSLPETMHRFAIDGRTFSDGESGHPIGVNLVGAIWGLAQVPLFGFPFGVYGAALGAKFGRRHTTGRGHLPGSDGKSPLLRKPPSLGGAT